MQRLVLLGVMILILAGIPGAAPAAESASPAASLMRLLKSGRVPEDRLAPIIEAIGRRGDASDLNYLYERAIDPQGYTGATRRRVLEILADTARTRKLKPSGSLAGLGRLCEVNAGVDAGTANTAIQLAGDWKVAALAPLLEKLALANDSRPALRQSAIDALVHIGGPAARAVVEKLAAKDQPQRVRYQGVAALADIDVNAAAAAAPEVLASGKHGDDPAPLIDAFLNRQGGAKTLAQALAGHKLSADTAKLALRHMYSIGRNDSALVDLFSNAAGISAKPKPPTDAEIQALISEVLAHGDPHRGENVFRRQDLSCMKCHSVSKAGGVVGPDLSPVGGTSPIEYLLKSVLDPDQAVKEAYLTHIIITDEGKVFQGILVDKDEQHLVLKDATGKQSVIPTADVAEHIEGRSLMPKGLVNFLTRDELVDLVSFLSQLGKPGEFAVQTVPTIQRWRVLKPDSRELIESVPNVETFGDRVLNADAGKWTPAYGKVAGELPLDELIVGGGLSVLYLQGEVDVTEGGAIGVRVDSLEAANLWVDDEPIQADREFTVDLSRGLHKITLRIDAAKRTKRELKVQFFKPKGSHAQFTVVGGS